MDRRVDGRTWIGLAALCLGMFMAILDIQIVATALPEIDAALGIGAGRASWIQTSYLVAEVIAIPLTGWLATAMSTRWLFCTATLGFVAASIACSAADGFAALVAARSAQGLCAGVLIPLVFAAVFQLFPERLQALATAIAGAVAMLAPALGPLAGGWIVEAHGWQWLFLVNVLPGIAVAATVAATIRIDQPAWERLRRIDVAALALLAASLASLEILLKEAPRSGWTSSPMLALAAGSAMAGALFVRRCLGRREGLVDLSPFGERRFSTACWYSFVLGMALYSAVYLMPAFLAHVRHHEPIAIGLVVIVTGMAQLVAAPFAAWAESRFAALPLTLAGYLLLGAGLVAGGFATHETDFDDMFWPQAARGFALPFCLLPVTRLALGHLPAPMLANASGLFNLMRNLGGAIGIALVDTLVEQRAPVHAVRLARRLEDGERAAALLVGLPPDRFTGQKLGPVDPAVVEMVRPLVERSAAVLAFNEAWQLLGAIALASLLALPLMRDHGPAGRTRDA